MIMDKKLVLLVILLVNAVAAGAQTERRTIRKRSRNAHRNWKWKNASRQYRIQSVL